jgi:dihydrofolate reductase
MEKVIVAAMAENRVIGKDDDIPWHYPEDLKHFRKLTTGYPVIMGRKTYFSLPKDYRPLSNRKNIVLTRSDVDVPDEVSAANSFEEAWKTAEKTGKDKVFVIGGASIYGQSLEIADKMIITEIHEEHDGDTYFPEWNEDNWEEVERNDREELSFVTYERK